MNGNDKKLKALLQRWPEIEPRPAFDQDVLRRIRLEAAKTAERADGFALWASRLTSRTGIAAAMAVAVAAGFVLSNTTPAPGNGANPAPDTVSDLLSTDSFSGSYVAMLNGGR